VESTRVAERRELIGRVTSVGGKVTFDYQYSDPRDPHDVTVNRLLDPPDPGLLRGILFGEDAAIHIHGVGFPNGHMPDNRTLQLMQSLNEVRHLELTATLIDDEALQEIGRIRSLWIISLRSTGITDDGLRWLSDLPELWGIGLLNLRLTDESLGHLQRMPHLSSVDVEDTWISERGRDSFTANRPDVEVFWSNPRDEAHREAMVELERVGFWVYRQEPERELSAYAVFAPDVELPAPAAYASVWRGSESDVELLLDIPRLEELSLNTHGLPHRFGDEALATVGRLVTLKELDLTDTAITDAGLAELTSLTQLEELDLSFTSIGDEGISHIKHLPQLTRLRLQRTWVTDKAIDDLAAMQSLEFLDIYGSDISTEGAERLREALPDCEVFSSLSQ
jgi:Leucine-rich repeat (LRR) protein